MRGFCQDCGKPTSGNTNLRCADCSRKRNLKNSPGELHGSWGKFRNDTTESGRQRARRRKKLAICERCGKPAIDRHHGDSNTLNNSQNNLVGLCRRCHMSIDGRLSRLIERNKKGRKYRDNAEKFRALRARRKAEGRPIK
jgi:hypothetical protein